MREGVEDRRGKDGALEYTIGKNFLVRDGSLVTIDCAMRLLFCAGITS